VEPDADYTPMMSPERAEQLRAWHEEAYRDQRASLPTQMRFMGLDLQLDEDVFAPHPDEDGSAPFHQAVADQARPGERVLDMGTGCGVSGILAARAGAEVVATDVNPRSVECARANAERNGVADRVHFVVGDLFERVEGDFDLIFCDPPFRWFRPRDMLERGTADENYRTLRAFMAEAPRRLREGGRILLNFGTSGDLDYLLALADRTGLRREMQQYGEASRLGVTARYYTILLSR
jgi:release factor glutamine methyltransferase